MKQKILIAIFTAMASNAIVTGAMAQTNVCLELMEDFLIPASVQQIKDCHWSKAECIGHSILGDPLAPICCTDACFANPKCWVWKKVTKPAKLLAAGDNYCDPDPKDFMELWLRREIANLADLLLGGLPSHLVDILEKSINAMKGRADHLPLHTQKLIKEMIVSVYDSGRTGFSYSDLANVKILSDSDPEADRWLRENAMTLGTLVLIKDEYYRQIMDEHNDFSFGDVQGRRGSWKYLEALEIVVHELVHVKQYRELGLDEFLSNYVGEVMVYDYGNASFEQEAYDFSAELSVFLAGEYCRATKEDHENAIEKWNLGVDYFCKFSNWDWAAYLPMLAM